MFCEKCGTQLQDSERFCPNCGTPAPTDTVSASNTVSASETAQNAAVQPEAAPNTVTDAAGVAQATGVAGDKPSKKKKGFIIAGVAAAVVLVVVIAVAFDITARVGNFVHKTFSSPEKYYQYVEKKNAEDAVDTVGDVYQLYLLDRKDLFNTTSNATVSLELAQGGQDLLELAGLAGVDMSWLESASFSSGLTIKGDQLGMNFSTAVNNDNVLSLAMALDIEAGEMYIQIPELTNTYIGIDFRDMLGSAYVRNLTNEWDDLKETFTETLASLPSQAKMEKLLNKYLEIALGCVDDVTKKSKTLKVEGVKQKCTVLEVTIDTRTAADMLDAILDEAEYDSTLEDFILDLADVYGEDRDDIYDEFIDGLDDLYRQLRGARGGDEIVLTVYVNGKGEVVGRELEVGDTTIALLMPEKGGKFGFEFSVAEGRTSVSFTGSGKRSGNKIDGDFQLRSNGAALLEITTDNLNLANMKKGQLNGKIEVSVGSGIGTVAGSMSGLSIIKDMKFTLSGKSSANSSKCTLGLVYKGEDLGSITVSTERKKASSVKIPKEKNVIFVEDARDLEDWFDEINWDKVISNLEKTDLPRSVIRTLEDWVDAIEDGDWGMFEDMASELMWYYYMLR